MDQSSADGLRADHDPRQRRLRDALDRLSAELVSIDAELTATRAIRANGGDDDEHDPDGIPLSSVLQLLEGQKARALEQSRGAEIALAEIDLGSYGICKSCARPIGAERLVIRPSATTCVACADRPLRR